MLVDGGGGHMAANSLSARLRVLTKLWNGEDHTILKSIFLNIFHYGISCSGDARLKRHFMHKRTTFIAGLR